MNTINNFLAAALFALILLAAGQKATAQQVVKDQIKNKAQPFSLFDVRLLDSPFKHAMEMEGRYLLMLEPDRFLHNFHKHAGLPVKGEIYGGWESLGVAGHSLGHYLSACSMMYASTGDERFKNRVDYIVDELKACQDARGTGYVGGIPDEERIWAEVSRGDIRSQGFDLNGGWVPWYTQHKIWAGLLDAYQWCSNQTAKKVVVKLSDWAYDNFSHLSEPQFQQMLACEHGGMNESLAEVYAITGNRKYLDLANRFHHDAVLNPLANQRDELEGKHANTQITKVIGCSRIYELTGSQSDSTIASFFWERVVNHHSYVTGGNSEREHFGHPDHLANRLSDQTTETCNTYNMLKLTKQLFSRDPQVKYADYYERALYNHILASQNPLDGMVCYMVPLGSGYMKHYSTPFESFWCCTGTGMENHVKYGEAVYFKENNRDLMVNLYIPSVLNWQEKGLVIRQEGNYPESEIIHFSVEKAPKGDFTIKFRKPWWANNGIILKINGKAFSPEVEAGYLLVTREWKNNDRVTLQMPMQLYTEVMPDDSTKAAILYGPLVLTAKLGEKGVDNRSEIPVLVTGNRPVDQWLKKSSDEPLAFYTREAGLPRDVELIPMYRMHHQHYMVYFDFFTADEWDRKQAEYLAGLRRQEEIEKRTVDIMHLGEMQPERDHSLQGDNTFTGEAFGRKWRDAREGGWFAFDMAVNDEAPLELVCTYWGSDAGNRVFDILIDDHVIATQTLENNQPDEFFEVAYPIPADMLKEKSKIRVKFQAHPGKTAGGVFGCRIIK